MDRTILHCDLNGFFASVELLSLPELRERPVAVCGNPSGRHGIILAKNERAKAFGVSTAETVWQARKKCPELVLVPPHRDQYVKYSRLVNGIYSRFTDLVEPFGIDESWLDVTGSMHLFGLDGQGMADRIRAAVREELGLTISVGVSFNKIFAKLGSDLKKPDATTVITREAVSTVVHPLPVSALLFVGRAAEEVLNRHGIRTIGELAGCDRQTLLLLLGRLGGQLSDYARGLDTSPVAPAGQRAPVKSVGNGLTFERNLTGWEEIGGGLALLSDSVAMRLRKDGLRCATVQVIIRNPQFKTISRQTALPVPTHLSRELSAAAMKLVRSVWNERAPVRMLTVTGTHLIPDDEYAEQLDLLEERGEARQRQERLERTMDNIRARYGSGSISFGFPAGGEQESDGAPPSQ